MVSQRFAKAKISIFLERGPNCWLPDHVLNDFPKQRPGKTSPSLPDCITLVSVSLSLSIMSKQSPFKD